MESTKKYREEYKRKIELRSYGILNALHICPNIRMQWTKWTASGKECYLIVFTKDTCPDIISKACESMKKAFRAADISIIASNQNAGMEARLPAIAITPKRT